MFDQFLVPLIGVVHWVKERFGIGDVNGYWNSQPSAFLPDGIEARIIHRDQLSRFVAHTQAKILQLFQAASASRDRVVELRHHLLTRN